MTDDPQHIVLIGSQLMTAALWRPMIGRLREGIEATVADGDGNSVAAIAQSILAKAPLTFVLAGHGMGGFVALEIVRQAPQRVSHLALINSLASADTPAQTERRLGYLHLVESGHFEQVIEERIPILLPPERSDDAVLLGLARQMAEETGAERFLRQQRAVMGRIDSRPTLGAITCPTLIVFGARDGITKTDHQQEMLAAIPGARLEIFERCGHLLPLEDPAGLASLLNTWIG